MRDDVPDQRSGTQAPPAGPMVDPAGPIARWERTRAMGRTGFVLRRGILGWGLPAALLTIVYKVVQEQGFVMSPRLTDDLRSAIVLALVVFPFCGWLFGRWLWAAGEAKYRMLVRDRDQAI
jgi:hypothetical protein